MSKGNNRVFSVAESSSVLNGYPMRDFFRPFRRKLGVLVLAMACLLMVGWVRSLKGTEATSFALGRHSLVQLKSTDGTLVVQKNDSAFPIDLVPGQTDDFLLVRAAESLLQGPRDIVFSFDEEDDWSTTHTEYRSFFHRFGFRIGCLDNKTYSVQACICAFPYWSLVLPLSLLSASLLLSKPRPKRTSEEPARGCFRGWKRQAGCVMLVMACMSAAGWIRSKDRCDSLDARRVMIASGNNSLFLLMFTAKADETRQHLALPGWESITIAELDDELSHLNWQYRRLGFGRAASGVYELWSIPYWLIVIPLASLSAYLLLSKPRPKTQQQVNHV